MVRKTLLLIALFSGISWADTGFGSTIRVSETDNTPACTVGQIKVSPATLTCSGQVATITTGGSGGGGGGSSTMQTTESGVEITSPTSSQNFLGLDFDLTAIGSTATIAIATVNSATHTWTAPQTMKSSFTVNNFLNVTATSNLTQLNATTSTFNGSVFYQGQTDASLNLVGNERSDLTFYAGGTFPLNTARFRIESEGAGNAGLCSGLAYGDTCLTSQKIGSAPFTRNGRMFFLADTVSDGTSGPTLPYQMIVAPKGVAFNTGETGSSVMMSTPIAPVHVGYGTLMPAIVGISTMSISSGSIVTDFPGDTYHVAIDSSSRTATFFGVKAGQSVFGTSSNTWTYPTADSAGCFQSDGAGHQTISACSSGGSFSLAIATGTSSTYANPATSSSSATSVLVLDQNQFTAVAAGATTYIGLGSNVDLLNSTQTMTAPKIFNSVEPSSFTNGAYASTITFQNRGGVGGGAITFRNGGGTNAQIMFNTDTGASMGNIGLVNATRFRFVNDLNGPFVWQTNDIDRMRIKYAGEIELVAQFTAISSGTFTGEVLLSSSVTIPQGTNPDVDKVGKMAFDTTDGALVMNDGESAKVMAVSTYSFTVTITSGTGWNGLTVPVWRAPNNMAVTLFKIMAESLPTGTTVLYQLDETVFGGTGAAGTDVFTVAFSTAHNQGVTTTASDMTNTGIAAQSSLVFNTPANGASGGSPSAITFTVFYKKDRE